MILDIKNTFVRKYNITAEDYRMMEIVVSASESALLLLKKTAGIG